MSQPIKRRTVRTITVAAKPNEYAVITAAAKAARMSRGQFLLKAAEEKLERDSQQAA